MEHKIGEIIILPDGRKVKVVEKIKGCKECALNGYDTQCWHIKEKGYCSCILRADRKDVIYKEVK